MEIRGLDTRHHMNANVALLYEFTVLTSKLKISQCFYADWREKGFSRAT